jgi:ectoine hydroxylase-related dioxygenase (phytanoyl-CoA dioxygenase family)
MHLKRFNKNFELNEVIITLQSDGVLVLDNYFDLEFINLLKKEYQNILDKKDDSNDRSIYTHADKDYVFVKSVSIKEPSQINNYHCLKTITKDINFYELTSKYFNKKFYYQKFFLAKTKFTSDTKEIFDKKNTYIPHTDELHFLKFFIYLDDTDEKNGCFFALPKTHKNNKKIRREWISDGKHRNLRDKEVYDKTNKLLPVRAKKGSVIVFDTDVTHRAGVIESKELSRNVVRLDAFCPHENYELKYQKATLKIKKIYRSILRTLNL